MPVRREFRDKLCVYCRRIKAETDDHIFSSKLFLEKDRGNLPEAPACRACNSKKSRLEHYLASVLPFGGRHEQAVENLQAGVPRRLSKNLKLYRELSRSAEPVWLRENGGLYQRTSMVAFDSSKLVGLLKFVGLGLAWHHWKIYLRPADVVSVMLLPDTASAVFASMTSNWRNAQRVVENLGDGTIRYVGVQAPDPPELTVWTIWMYGGLVLSDDRRKSEGDMESCSMWWVITGPPEIEDMTERLK